jgi:hypothetical protein
MGGIRQAGLKPLGPIVELCEDEVGARYRVELHDTSFGRELALGLRSGLYGASFRFLVQMEEIEPSPGALITTLRASPSARSSRQP